MNEWISVEDRRPTDLGDYSVVVHFENGSIETVHVEDWMRDGLCEFSYKITHWYKPEPPK